MESKSRTPTRHNAIKHHSVEKMNERKFKRNNKEPLKRVEYRHLLHANSYANSVPVGEVTGDYLSCRKESVRLSYPANNDRLMR